MGATDEPQKDDLELLRTARAGDAEAMCRVAILRARAGDVDEAEAWARRAVGLGHAPAFVLLGRLLRDRGDRAGAILVFEQGAEAGSAESASNVGYLLASAGDDAGARRWYRRAAESGHVWAMNALGRTLEWADEDDEALVWFERSAAMGDAEGALLAGAAYHRAGDLATAEPLLRRGLDADPALASFRLGKIEMAERRNLEAALRLFERACPEDGETPRWFHADAMAFRGSVLFELGDEDRCWDWLLRGADAGSTGAQIAAGKHLVMCGHWRRGEDLLTRAAAKGAGADVTWFLGYCAEARGDDARADALYAEAAAGGFDDTAARSLARMRRAWWAWRYAPVLVVVALVFAVSRHLVPAWAAAATAVILPAAVWVSNVVVGTRKGAPPGGSMSIMLRAYIVVLAAIGVASVAVAAVLAAVPMIVSWRFRLRSERIDAEALPGDAAAIVSSRPDIEFLRLPDYLRRAIGSTAMARPGRQVMVAESELRGVPERAALVLAHEVAHVLVGFGRLWLAMAARTIGAVVLGASVAAGFGVLAWHGPAAGASAPRAFLVLLAGMLVIDHLLEPFALAYQRRVELRADRVAVDILPDPAYAISRLLHGCGGRRSPRLHHLLSSVHPHRDAYIRLGRELEAERPGAAS